MTTSLGQRLAEILGQPANLNTRNLVTRSGHRERGHHTSQRFGRMPWESVIERQILERLDQSWMTTKAEAQAIKLRVPSLSDERGFFRIHARRSRLGPLRPNACRRG